jgi:hypothetical protein
MAVKHKRGKFSFDRLIKPYSQGGLESKPVTRTIDLQIDWLINKKNYPLDIVGSALLITYTKLYYGHVKFHGDGTYGSKGHQLDRYLAETCEKIYQQRLQFEVGLTLLEKMFVEQVADLIKLTASQRFFLWLSKKSEDTGHWL